MGGGGSKVEESETAHGRTESAPEEREAPPQAKVLLSRGLIRDLEHRLVEQQIQQQGQRNQQVSSTLGEEVEVDETQNFRLLKSAGNEGPILRGAGACKADEAACIQCLNDVSMGPSKCSNFVKALEICVSEQVKLSSQSGALLQ